MEFEDKWNDTGLSFKNKVVKQENEVISESY